MRTLSNTESDSETIRKRKHNSNAVGRQGARRIGRKNGFELERRYFGLNASGPGPVRFQTEIVLLRLVTVAVTAPWSRGLLAVRHVRSFAH